jgi:3-oxoacyl-[acyl-carrier-protein] synthase II
MHRRVVITGIGLVSPVGLNAQTTWQALLAGKSGIGPITHFDASQMTARIAGEINDFDPLTFLERKEVRRMDTFSHFAIAATTEALDDAKYVVNADNAERIGVYIGSGIGGLPLLEKTAKLLNERGPRKISVFFIPGMIVNLAAGNVSIRFGIKGPNLAVSTACATGAHAVGESYRLIREGYCDAMIAGGTEAVISPLAIGGFCAMKALSTRNDDPATASRPFDLDRDGFVMGEGAGIVLLEERDSAIARGARIYAEIRGYGISGDAHHISAPSPDGDGPARAMRMALDRAGVEPDNIDYINAHGTSTPLGDSSEITAVKSVFNEHAHKMVVASTKSMTGHLLGAAGGLETAITALAVHHDMIPPTINQFTPDPACDLDCAANERRPMKIRYAMNNSFGFGGTNVSLLLRKDS